MTVLLSARLSLHTGMWDCNCSRLLSLIHPLPRCCSASVRMHLILPTLRHLQICVDCKAFSHGAVNAAWSRRSPPCVKNYKLNRRIQVLLRKRSFPFRPAVSFRGVPPRQHFLNPARPRAGVQSAPTPSCLAGDKHLVARLCCRATSPSPTVFSLF